MPPCLIKIWTRTQQLVLSELILIPRHLHYLIVRQACSILTSKWFLELFCVVLAELEVLALFLALLELEVISFTHIHFLHCCTLIPCLDLSWFCWLDPRFGPYLDWNGSSLAGNIEMLTFVRVFEVWRRGVSIWIYISTMEEILAVECLGLADWETIICALLCSGRGSLRLILEDLHSLYWILLAQELLEHEWVQVGLRCLRMDQA